MARRSKPWDLPQFQATCACSFRTDSPPLLLSPAYPVRPSPARARLARGSGPPLPEPRQPGLGPFSPTVATLTGLGMACCAFRVSLLRTLPFAPVLSALQVPHTQRLQELKGDDWLGPAAGPQVCRAELVQRLPPGDPGPVGVVRLWQASRAVCRLPLSSESLCGAGHLGSVLSLPATTSRDTAPHLLRCRSGHRGGRDPVKGGPSCWGWLAGSRLLILAKPLNVNNPILGRAWWGRAVHKPDSQACLVTSPPCCEVQSRITQRVMVACPGVRGQVLVITSEPHKQEKKLTSV